jgi:inorganic pyrophosphatase
MSLQQVPHTLCGDGDPVAVLVVHFFEHYKDLERNKWVRTGGWKGVERAGQVRLGAGLD